MTNRLIMFFGLVSGLIFLPQQANASDQSRPNVLLIGIDDLNDWTGFLEGHPQAKTPNLDEFASKSRVFANAHCAVPVCSPSRVSLMSGLYSSSHGSYELGPSYESIPKLETYPTLQAYFKQHGYRVVSGGKVLHHGFRGRLSDDIDLELGLRRGGPRPQERIHWKNAVWDWGPYPADDAQMDDFKLAGRAAEELENMTDKPWLMTVGFFRPHVPMHVPSKWFDQFPLQQVQLPVVFDNDLEDVPTNFQNMPQIAPTHQEVVSGHHWESLVQAYLASVAFVDHCVGHLLNELEKSNHAKNTIVIIWSDHGFHLGEKQHWAKRTLWEESTRVPLLIGGPGIQPGEYCREAVSLVDLYPTLIDLCDLPARDNLDGLSLVPQLKDPETPRERPVLISSYEGNHAVRTRDWRYIRYVDGAEELYDHRTDPAEYINLAGDPRYTKQLSELAQHIPESPAPEVIPRKQREATQKRLAKPKASKSNSK